MLIIAVLGAGVIYARLSMGPIQLPWLATTLAEVASAESDDYELRIRNVTLRLGESNEASGIIFDDVAAYAPDGTLLMTAPRVVTRLHLLDLIQGKVRPTRVSLIRPSVEIVRAEDGRFRIGLGTDGEYALLPSTRPTSSAEGQDEGFDAIARVMDGFVGDIEAVEQLAKLDRISIIGFDLIYDDEVLKQTWRTERANIRIWRTSEGAEGRLDATIDEDAGAKIPIQISASRKRGGGTTLVEVRFDNLTTAAVSHKITSMELRDLVDTKVSGYSQFALERDGTLGEVSGAFHANKGTVLGASADPKSFDELDIAFGHVPGSNRVTFSRLSVEATALDASFTGFIDLEVDAAGDVEGLAAQLDVGNLRLDLPEIFAEQIEFDGGQLVARLDLDDATSISVKNSFLTYEDLILEVGGRVRADGDDWLTDVRATGRNVSVEKLIAYWPLAAAVNARDWIASNISAGRVDALVSHLRIAKGEPQLSLDFSFSELTSRYITGMSPIEGASGQGHLTFHDFYLFMDHGHVVPQEGKRIVLNGSSMVFRDLWGIVTPTEVELTGGGDLGAILRLIDQDPLNLVRKIDLDPSQINGTASIDSRFTFPLLNDLLIDQIFVDVNASIADVQMPFELAGKVLDVSGERITLNGTTTGMKIAGDVVVDGAPLNLDWTENYGLGDNQRSIRAVGKITPALLARFDAAIPGFETGDIVADVGVTQTGTPDTDIDVNADLAGAELSIADLGWSKAKGVPGRLKVKARLGDDITIDSFAMKSSGFDAAGKLTLTAAGGIKQANLTRFILDDRIDAAGVISVGTDGLKADITGKRVNLTSFWDSEETPSDEPKPNLQATFTVADLVLTEDHSMSDAKGSATRTAIRTTANLDGKLGPTAQVAMTYEQEGEAPGTLSVKTAQSGELLEYLGIYPGAVGGEMNLHARVDPKPGVDLSGLLKIRGLYLTQGDGLTKVLKGGRFAQEQVIEVQNGVTFSSIRVPFDYANNVINVGESFAKSPSLAITAQGAVSPEEDDINLAGVISPAYGLTSGLDNVPILGRILTGKEGEGIFGMTFSLTGSLDDPQVSINPLSLLTPGFLRGVFSSKGKTHEEGFAIKNTAKER
ncbi:AsmA-like C-terminal domain-containing protein [Rhodobacteraceae bacterium NNCM2]|nr:AsmA-like C-terminal domain-containing protein [Coraliihabitans acroporae]